jgi:hypothetical protein
MCSIRAFMTRSALSFIAVIGAHLVSACINVPCSQHHRTLGRKRL